jgi:hypothetical protein
MRHSAAAVYDAMLLLTAEQMRNCLLQVESTDCGTVPASVLLVNAGEDSCCPDGFDCVPSPSSQRSSCKWTGRPIVPPADYITSAKQKTPKHETITPVADISADVVEQPGRGPAENAATKGQRSRGLDPLLLSGRRLKQAVCTTGFLCADTSLVTAGQPTCNSAGKLRELLMAYG